MTTVTFRVDGVDYSNFVIQADTWRESLTGIGRWEVVLDIHTAFWAGVFQVDQIVVIEIDGVRMMAGYIDDVQPFLIDRGTATVYYRLSGRDYGIDLALLYLSASYNNTQADDIVQAALIASTGEIRHTSLSAAPFINYEFDRTFMADGIRDLAQNVGYDFYVENNRVGINAIMQFFPVGDPNQYLDGNGGRPDIDLISIANNVANNILAFDIGELIGFNIANRVEVIAGPLKDHYTDLNAADWIGTNCAVTDELTVFLWGKGALLAINNSGGNAQLTIDLTFPRYDHTVLDMSESGTGKYDYWMHDTITAIKRLRIRLKDVNNNWIEFYRSKFAGLAKCYNCTDQPDNDEWRTVNFPIGEESGIEPALVASTGGIWYDWNIVAPPFDWSQVDQIRLTTTGAALAFGPPADYFILDGLFFSNVEVISIATDPAPIGGTRMLPVFRPDIRNQMELDAFAAWKLARTQDPLENIQITAIGQTGTPYAGQSLDVQITGYIPVITEYRIFELHHQVVKSSEESIEKGYTFITEYNLVRHNKTAGGIQLITPEKALFPISPRKTDIRNTRDYIRALQRNNFE